MKQYRHSVFWGNPYTEPPNNLPRVLFFVVDDNHRGSDKFRRKANAILDRLREKGIFTYVIGFSVEENSTPPRRWSSEAKQRNRLRRLEARLKKEYSIPELLKMAMEEKINSNRSYYLCNEN